MAQYLGSPFGIIRGKFGRIQAYRAKGKNIIKALPHRKIKEKDIIKKINNGEIKDYKKYIKKLNVIIVFGKITVTIGKELLNKVIYPVWENIAKKKRYKGSGFNLFTKVNAIRLYNSINKEKLIAKDNLPNLERLVISYGSTERAIIKNAIYYKETGQLYIEWEEKGLELTKELKWSEDDDVFYVVIHWLYEDNKIVPMDCIKNIKIFGNAYEPIAKRKDGKAILNIEKKLKETDLFYCYLFFKFKNEFSISLTKKITFT